MRTLGSQVGILAPVADESEALLGRLNCSGSIPAALMLAVECEELVKKSLDARRITQPEGEALYSLFDQAVNAKLDAFNRVSLYASGQMNDQLGAR